MKGSHNEENQNLDRLFESKLFSAGIEHRFISDFSSHAQKEISNLTELLGEQLSLSTSEDDQKTDQFLLSIMNHSQDKDVDAFIKVIQRASPECTEIDVVRIVFACMIKFRQKSTNTVSEILTDHSIDNEQVAETMSLVTKLKTIMSTSKEAEENFESYFDQLNSLPEFGRIKRRWSNSCKILNHFKRQIDTFTEQTVQKYKKDSSEHKEEDIKEEETKTPQKIEEVKGEQNEETIDTTTTKGIDAASQSKVDKEVQLYRAKIIEGLKQKAEVLLKMVTPNFFDHKELVKNTIVKKGTSTKYKSQMKPKLSGNVRRKLTTDQLDKIPKKDVFDGSQSSVLAYFKLELNAKEIMKKVERVVVDTLKRAAGFRLISTIIKNQVNLDDRI